MFRLLLGRGSLPLEVQSVSHSATKAAPGRLLPPAEPPGSEPRAGFDSKQGQQVLSLLLSSQLLALNSLLEQESANFLHEGSDDKQCKLHSFMVCLNYSSLLSECGSNGCGCVPIKLYLHKQAEGQIWSLQFANPCSTALPLWRCQFVCFLP